VNAQKPGDVIYQNPSAVVNGVVQSIQNNNNIIAIQNCQPITVTDLDVILNGGTSPVVVQFVIELRGGLVPYSPNQTGWQPLSPAPSGPLYLAYIHTATVPVGAEYSAPDFKLLQTLATNPLPIIVHVGPAADDPLTVSSYRGIIFSPSAPSLSGLASALPPLDAPSCDPTMNPAVPIYTITGNLIIDADFCMTYTQVNTPPARTRAQYYLTPGAQIQVQSGKTLTMIEADFVGCETLWKGIEVQSGGVLVADKVTLNDARYAIDAKAGATLQLTNNVFTDNYVGLQLDMGNAPAGVARRVTLKGLDGNTFQSSGNGLKSPYTGMPEKVENRGYCGIRLHQYQDFNVSGTNNFSVLANGLIATNSILNVSGLHFDDMRSTASQPQYNREGYGMYLAAKGGGYWANINELYLPEMNFTHCKTGIYVFGMAGRVDNCYMKEVGTGIDWLFSKQRDIRLRKNTITATNYGIRSVGNEPLDPTSIMDHNTIEMTGVTSGTLPVTGINLLEIAGSGSITNPPTVEGWELNTNTVTMQHSGYGIYYLNGVGGMLTGNTVTNLANASGNNYTGLRVENVQFSDIRTTTADQSAAAMPGLGTSIGLRSSGGWANTYSCNHFTRTNLGMQFFDMADYTDAVRGNTFGIHGTGLQMGESGIGGVYVGDQKHTGNTWNLAGVPAGGFGGVHWGGPTIAPLSEFFVNGVANASLHPPVDPANWFKDEPGNTFSDCPRYQIPGQEPPAKGEDTKPDELDQAIVGDQLPVLGFAAATQWKGKYRLYRKMLRHPGWATDYPAYAAFKTTNDQQSTGQLAYIAEERSKLFLLSPTEKATLENYRLALATQNKSLYQKDSLLQKGQFINASQYHALVQQHEAKLGEDSQYKQGLTQARQQKIQNLLALNAAVATTQLIDANHKTVNGIVLNLLTSDSLLAGQLTTLTAIAGQCPMEGGDAVYEARSIVTYYTGAGFNDSQLCANANNREAKPEQDQLAQMEEIVLYPNPTSGHLFWSGTTGTIALRVFNSLGLLQMEQKNAENFLDISSLPNGFYTIQLLAPDQTLLANRKLLVQKH